jgi:hypothetical protein
MDAERTGQTPERLPARLPLRPDNLRLFRLARLLLLLDVVRQTPRAPQADMERLGFYDFFAANPFLVVGRDDRVARRELALAGFDSQSLSYQSSSQRFTSRRERLQHDLALLLAYGLVATSVDDTKVTYSITPSGVDRAQGFRAIYARAYRRSAGMIIRRLRSLSDGQLHSRAREWLRAESLLIDILDVGET